MAPEVQLQFVNGDHGFKNSLAVDSVQTIEDEKNTPSQNNGPNNENQFQCPQCSKLFHSERILNRHMKCHSVIKKYPCSHCDKRFDDTFDVKRHERVHTGIKPFKCIFCGRSFTQRGSLENHLLNIHDVQQQYAYNERREKVISGT